MASHTLKTLTEAIAQEGYVEVEMEGKLYYQTYETGSPVIILYGQPLNHDYFLPEMLELAKDHQVTLKIYIIYFTKSCTCNFSRPSKFCSRDRLSVLRR